MISVFLSDFFITFKSCFLSVYSTLLFSSSSVIYTMISLYALSFKFYSDISLKAPFNVAVLSQLSLKRTFKLIASASMLKILSTIASISFYSSISSSLSSSYWTVAFIPKEWKLKFLSWMMKGALRVVIFSVTCSVMSDSCYKWYSWIGMLPCVKRI